MPEIKIPKRAPIDEHQKRVNAYMSEMMNESPFVWQALQRGRTIYADTVHVSRSGMSRRIKFLVAVDIHGRAPEIINISHVVGHLSGYKKAKHENALIVDDVGGPDAGAVAVYNMSQTLHGDGYALKQESV